MVSSTKHRKPRNKFFILCLLRVYSSVTATGELRGDFNRLWSYSRQLLEGLSYMHSKKIIHFDLKLDNILLTVDGQIKISDLGLTTTTKSVLEQYRSGISTSYHIAPELKIKNTRSRNVDMYSFGFVLFQMCFCPLGNREGENLLKIIQTTENPIPMEYKYHDGYELFFMVILLRIVNRLSIE